MSYYGDSASEKAAMRLEAKIKRIYAEAARDVEQKILHYTDTFKKRDAEMQKKLKNGEISQADYDNWKSRIVFRGKRWNNVRDTIWSQLYHTRQTTTDMINDERKAMFQNVVNYSQYQIDKDFNFSLSFNIYDNATVTKLIKEDPDLVPDVKYPVPGRDYAWSKKQIASAATQGVIQGESIPEISRRIANKLSSANMVSMTRCARTAMTGAHNSGRIEAMHNAQDLGIKVQKLWIATLDSRTRDWHRDLDGQLAEVDEPFYSHFGEIMYPGDPNARPANLWNCRCSLGWEYPEYKNQYDTRAARDEDPESETYGKTIEVKDMTYREWEKLKQAGQSQRQEKKQIEFKVLSENDIKNLFGQRPEFKLRRTNKEEYFRLREEYENSAYWAWKQSLSNEEERAIGDYSADVYVAINGLCRKQMTKKMVDKWSMGTAKPIEEEIKLIENAINRFELKENIKVYRTCKTDVLNDIKNNGGVFKDNGFTSSSIFNKQVASGTVDIEINVPAGFGRGAWIQPLSGAPDENEFLLQRGGIYQVDEITEENGRTKVKMTMIGTEPDEVAYATKDEVIKLWRQKGLEFTKDDENNI